MSFIDLFKSKEARQKLSHLKDLVGVALADGKLEKNELVAIAAICTREGIDVGELERCIKNPKGIRFNPPQDEKTKVTYLTDMVMLMMCDGHIDKKEMTTCKLCAEALGFRQDVIDVLIQQIITVVKEKQEIGGQNQ